MDNTQETIRNALSHQYTIITGLEGCRKSLGAIEQVLAQTTADNPVIVGIKNFELMSEQRKNWISYFNLTSDQVAICGVARTEVALKHYTNIAYPSLVPMNCRVILMSQKAIQMGHH